MSFIQFLEIAGLLFVALELFLLFAEARKARDAQRKLATLDYLTAHYDSYIQFREWLESFPAERLTRPAELTDDERAKIRGYLIMVERMSVGIGQGMFSFDYVANVTNKNIRRAYVALHPVIVQAREVAGSEKVWDAFEWLCFELERLSNEPIIPDHMQNNHVFKPTRDYLRIRSR